VNYKRVTIKEVAEAAGVSAQTVSRVANDHPDVATKTRDHVQGIINELGYQPSKIARSLIRGQSYSLGVICYGLSFFGPSLALQGIQEAAVQAGYSLMLNILPDAEANDVEKTLHEILSYHVDGILWAVPEIGQNQDWIQQARPNFSVPIVFLNIQPRPNLVTASIDNKYGGCIATQHLIDQGRQNIGIITGPMGWREARQRELGWREALAENNRVVDESYIVNGDWSPSSGERGIRMLLEWHPETDAVFVCNDQMALGAMKVAQKMGRRIPQDLAIVGYYNIPESPYFSPALSTVYQDIAELGYQGVQQLLAMINNGNDALIPAVVVQPELIVRESSVDIA
jgi:LacI family transcriptional regulator